MIDTKHPYARTYWKHTQKAIRRGEPATRRFAVVGYDTEEKCLIAWKVEVLDEDELTAWHPAYGNIRNHGDCWLDENDEPILDLFPLTAANDAEPSAMFNPDSLYVLCI